MKKEFLIGGLLILAFFYFKDLRKMVPKSLIKQKKLFMGIGLAMIIYGVLNQKLLEGQGNNNSELPFCDSRMNPWNDDKKLMDSGWSKTDREADNLCNAPDGEVCYVIDVESDESERNWYMQNYEIAVEYWANLTDPPPLQRRIEDDPRDYAPRPGCTCPPGKKFKKINIDSDQSGWNVGDINPDNLTEGMRGFMWWCEDSPDTNIDDILKTNDGTCRETERQMNVPQPAFHRCRDITTMGDCIGRTGPINQQKCGPQDDAQTCNEIINEQCTDGKNHHTCRLARNILYQCTWDPGQHLRLINGTLSDEQIIESYHEQNSR